jgi:metal-responsive CopG/Arc/MetJ family transcriptional regulator
MRATVTLPDDLFERADEAAARLRISRSRLYQEAVEAFLRRLDEEKLTERMNAFVDRHGQAVGESLAGYAATAWRDVHGDDEW